MRFYVRLEAFQNGKPRPVDVPDKRFNAALNDEEKLELIYLYGQNDRQRVEGCSSVSCGDVIEYLNGAEYEVGSFGFKFLNAPTLVTQSEERRFAKKAAEAEQRRSELTSLFTDLEQKFGIPFGATDDGSNITLTPIVAEKLLKRLEIIDRLAKNIIDTK